MPTTDQDLRALTYLARRLRDETNGCRQWDEAGTYSVLKGALAGTNLLIACERIIAHATDPTAQTPGAIKRPFTPEPTHAPARVPFDPRLTCATCGAREATCRASAEHPFVSVERERAAPAAPRPKTVAVIRDELCTHGVKSSNCTDHRTRERLRANTTEESK